MSMLATAPILSMHAHSGISRKRLPQTWDNTDTVRSAPVLRKFSISARWNIVHDVFLCQLWSVSILCISDLLNCFHLAPRTQLLLQMNTTLKMWGQVFIIVPRCKTQKTPRLTSLGLNWAHGCMYLEFLLLYPPSFRNFTDELFKLRSSYCRRSYSLTERMSTVLHKFS